MISLKAWTKAGSIEELLGILAMMSRTIRVIPRQQNTTSLLSYLGNSLLVHVGSSHNSQKKKNSKIPKRKENASFAIHLQVHPCIHLSLLTYYLLLVLTDCEKKRDMKTDRVATITLHRHVTSLPFPSPSFALLYSTLRFPILYPTLLHPSLPPPYRYSCMNPQLSRKK